MAEGGIIAMLFLVGFIFVVFTLIYFCLRKKKDAGYRQVLEGDELDEEELAFKKSLEEQNAEFGVDDELEFDDKELEQLRMLDEYREDIMKDEDGEDNKVEGNNKDINKQIELTIKEKEKTHDKKIDGPNLKISLPSSDTNQNGSLSPSLVKRHSPRTNSKGKKQLPPQSAIV
jgi:hypothetical protein